MVWNMTVALESILVCVQKCGALQIMPVSLYLPNVTHIFTAFFKLKNYLESSDQKTCSLCWQLVLVLDSHPCNCHSYKNYTLFILQYNHSMSCIHCLPFQKRKLWFGSESLWFPQEKHAQTRWKYWVTELLFANVNYVICKCVSTKNQPNTLCKCKTILHDRCSMHTDLANFSTIKCHKGNINMWRTLQCGSIKVSIYS